MRTKMMQCVPASNCRNTRAGRDWGWHLAKPPWRGLGCPQILPFPKGFWGSALVRPFTRGHDQRKRKVKYTARQRLIQLYVIARVHSIFDVLLTKGEFR